MVLGVLGWFDTQGGPGILSEGRLRGGGCLLFGRGKDLRLLDPLNPDPHPNLRPRGKPCRGLVGMPLLGRGLHRPKVMSNTEPAWGVRGRGGHNPNPTLEPPPCASNRSTTMLARNRFIPT